MVLDFVRVRKDPSKITLAIEKGLMFVLKQVRLKYTLKLGKISKSGKILVDKFLC